MFFKGRIQRQQDTIFLHFDGEQGLAQTEPLVNQSTSYRLTRVINTPERLHRIAIHIENRLKPSRHTESSQVTYYLVSQIRPQINNLKSGAYKLQAYLNRAVYLYRPIMLLEAGTWQGHVIGYLQRTQTQAALVNCKKVLVNVQIQHC